MPPSLGGFRQRRQELLSYLAVFRRQRRRRAEVIEIVVPDEHTGPRGHR